MSGLLHRRKAAMSRTRQDRPVNVPAWRELIRLDEPEITELAERLAIDTENMGRMETLSAIHRAR